jgi:subtilisin family serine protease
VEFFAPGQNITVAWTGGASIRSSGNSFATPFVAGLCARVLAEHPDLPIFQIKNILYLLSSNVTLSSGGCST